MYHAFHGITIVYSQLQEQLSFTLPPALDLLFQMIS